MRVSIDARPVALPGIGRFASELASALLRRAEDPEVVALGPPTGPRRNGPGVGGASLGPFALAPPRGATAVRSRPFGLAEQFELPRLLRRLGVDVHHATHLALPRRSPVPVVLTVHDLFPLRHPDHARSAAARAYYRAVLPSAVRAASAVVAVSDSTASELERLLGVRPHAVIGHGVDHAAWSGPAVGSECRPPPGFPDLPRPYVLYVGTAKPHKNLATLLAAFRASSALPPLVLAGPDRREVDALLAGRARPGRASAADLVRALGRVPDAWLPLLYRGAAAVAVPSLYEGVGLTALEAMSFGVPVVAADSPGLRDTVGDSAALVPPTEVDAWVDALSRMSGTSARRDAVVARGRERAAAHRWDDVAAAYVGVYESVYERERAGRPRRRKGRGRGTEN